MPDLCSHAIPVLLGVVLLLAGTDCQDNSGSTGNARMARVVERHSENIRQFLCRKGQSITPEQWERVKSECIDTRLEDLMPENAITVWQECSQRVSDLCDDQQWMDGKDCARDMIKDEDIGEMHLWYRTRVRQMTGNFQVIKSCFQKQRSTK